MRGKIAIFGGEKQPAQRTGQVLRGTMALLFALFVSISCEGQNRKPVKLDVKDNPGHGTTITTKTDTVYITKIETITKTDTITKTVEVKVPEPYPVEVIKEIEVIKTVEVPVEVIKTVEVIKEVKVPEPYPVEVIKTVEVEKGATTDTLQTISDVVLLDYTAGGLQPTNKPAVYAMIAGIGLAEIKTDTVHSWQRAYNLKRIKSYGSVSYESVGLPFQVRKMEPILGQTTIKAVTHFTENCRVFLYLNNKLVAAISDTDTSPLTATKVSAIEYRHGRTFTGLTPDTEYEIMVEGRTADGRKTFSEPAKFRTLK